MRNDNFFEFKDPICRSLLTTSDKWMYLRGTIFIIIFFTFPSCEKDYEPGRLPDIPQNMEEFNTRFDDYNSIAPPNPNYGKSTMICFSTNRWHGNNFDIVYEPLDIDYSAITGILQVKNESNAWYLDPEDRTRIEYGLHVVNTPGDELGPYMVYDRQLDLHYKDFDHLLLLYATNSGGNFDLMYTSMTDSTYFIEPEPLNYLNSGADDYYPTFNTEFSRIFFCSNRKNGVFNIFSIPFESQNDNLVDDLTSMAEQEITIETVLSSNYDDKCPFIYFDMLVFTSNRPGGFGSFDLYYSELEDGKWSAPRNFGEKINTAADEYRPIIINEYVDPDKEMMIFSSNREGGKGGFDLYYVGVEYDGFRIPDPYYN